MPKPLRLAVAALRYAAIAVCLMVLVFSLVMWPRSLYYLDHVGLPFEGWQSVIVKAGPLGGSVTGGYPAVSSTAGCIAYSGIGPRPPGDWLSGHQSSRTVFQTSPIELGRTVWLPSYKAARPLIVIPYWLPAMFAAVGIAACRPTATWRWLANLRFGVAEMLFATSATATVLATHQLLGPDDAVVVGECFLFAAVAWGAILKKRPADRPRRRADWWIGLTALIALLLLSSFAIYVHTGYQSWFEPVDLDIKQS